MAGERPVQATEAVNPFSVVLTHRVANSTNLVDQFVFYCEQDMVLDAAFAIWSVASGAGTITLERVASGTAPGSGTAITSALDITGTANTTNTMTVNTANNVIPAGQWITIDVTGVVSNIVGLTLTLRLRQKRR